MQVGKPEIIQEDGQAVCRSAVTSAKGNEVLWYSVPEIFVHLLSDSSDAFLVGLLIPAMAMGEDMHIGGSISDRLFYNLSGPLQRLLKHVFPALNLVGIYPDSIANNHSLPATGVATGFSGGIDSFCVLADHYYKEIPENFRITHLLFSNVGSHGSGGERLFRERYERLLPAAESLGLPLVTINSNLQSFYRKGLGFKRTHTFRNASVGLLLQGGIGRYLFASGYDYSKVFVGPTNDLNFTDTITLPLLSTANIDIFSAGAQHTRVEKTLLVAEVPLSYTALDVCVSAKNHSGFPNCGTCKKCLRTLATLDVADYLDRYSAVFDLNAYQKRRAEYLSTLAGSDDLLQQEIAQLAKERIYPIPGSDDLSSRTGVASATGWSKRVVRKLKQAATRSN